MRLFAAALIIIVFLAPLCLAASYVPGQVIVKLRDGVIDVPAPFIKSATTQINIKNADAKQKFEKLKIGQIEKVFKNAVPKKTFSLHVRSKRPVEVPDLSQFYILSFPAEQDVLEMVRSLKADPNVIAVNPNYIMRAFSTTPNDTLFSEQWGLTKSKLPQTWDVAKGLSGTLIAVVDTGVEYSHEDLNGKITLGYDYINNDNDPLDDNGHGTHIAGIIAALTNNSKGVAGINWNAKVLAVKALDSTGSGTYSQVENGIQYAADNNASIINLSLGEASDSADLKAAIDYAAAKGCIIFAAAGNENTSAPVYPAAYTNVMAVAATDSNDRRSVWNGTNASNYGSWVDISAPGSTIHSTYISNSYSDLNGTSMASPFVAGVASLLLEIHPSWNYSDVFNQLTSTATNIDAQNPSYVGMLGSGRLDAQSALALPIAQITHPGTMDAIAGTVQIKGTANAISLQRYTLKIGAGSSPSAYSTIETGSSAVISGTLATYTSSSTSDGTYTLNLAVENTQAQTSEASRTFIIDNTSPTAEITSPASGASVTDSINITGSARDQNFSYYTLEYAPSDGSYQQILANTSSVEANTLGTWNTSGLSGAYTLRLSVTDRAGNISRKSVSLNIGNSSVSSKTVSGISYGSPNPFNPTTQSTSYISYDLSGNFNTSVFLFDITGRLIFKRDFTAGENGGKAGRNLVAWNGKDNFGLVVSNGVYVFKIVADGKVLNSGKIIVLY